VPPLPVANIPTLSQWGIIILAALFGVSAAVAMKRRRASA